MSMPDLKLYPSKLCLIKYHLNIHVFVSLKCLYPFSVSQQKWFRHFLLLKNNGENIKIKHFFSHKNNGVFHIFSQIKISRLQYFLWIKIKCLDISTWYYLKNQDLVSGYLYLILSEESRSSARISLPDIIWRI